MGCAAERTPPRGAAAVTERPADRGNRGAPATTRSPAELYRRHAPWPLAHLRPRCADDGIAAEALQETPSSPCGRRRGRSTGAAAAGAWLWGRPRSAASPAGHLRRCSAETGQATPATCRSSPVIVDDAAPHRAMCIRPPAGFPHLDPAIRRPPRPTSGSASAVARPCRGPPSSPQPTSRSRRDRPDPLVVEGVTFEVEKHSTSRGSVNGVGRDVCDHLGTNGR